MTEPAEPIEVEVDEVAGTVDLEIDVEPPTLEVEPTNENETYTGPPGDCAAEVQSGDIDEAVK